MRSGFGALKDQQAKADAAFKGNSFIPYVRLRDDGDIIQMRVMSECEDSMAAQVGVHSVMLSGEFHNVQSRTQSGKTRFSDILCSLEEDDAGELVGECPHCSADNKRSTKFMMWVWVYAIYHRTQSTDPKNQFPRGRLGAQTVYKEELNTFMVWQDGYYMTQMLESRVERLGTLTDRDYLITRHGLRGQQKVTRDLDGEDPTPLDMDIVALSAALPSLLDIATGAVTNLDGTGPSPEQAPTEEYSEVELPTFGGTSGSTFDDGVDDLPF